MQTAEENKTETNHTAKEEYRVDIFMAWCKSCGICVAFCPRKCLDQHEDGSPVLIRPDLCIGCGWCEIHCPDFAISLREVTNESSQGEEEAE